MALSPLQVQTLLSKRDGKVEACGLILKDGTIIDLVNVHASPDQAFHIAAADVIKYELDMAATWHTHVGKAYPSGADYVCFRNWSKLNHYIVGDDGLKCYNVEAGTVYEAPV